MEIYEVCLLFRIELVSFLNLKPVFGEICTFSFYVFLFFVFFFVVGGGGRMHLKFV